MHFETQAQEQCYGKVSEWMREMFGEQTMVNDQIPQFALFIGTALVTVTVFPWTDNEASIAAHSWVVTGAETSPDLLRYLLEKNTEMRFGAFGMDKEGDIF